MCKSITKKLKNEKNILYLKEKHLYMDKIHGNIIIGRICLYIL